MYRLRRIHDIGRATLTDEGKLRVKRWQLTRCRHEMTIDPDTGQEIRTPCSGLVKHQGEAWHVDKSRYQYSEYSREYIKAAIKACKAASGTTRLNEWLDYKEKLDKLLSRIA